VDYIIAFLVGGFICGIGQLILDLTTLTPGHVLVLLTVIGALAGGFGLYQPFLSFAKAGALVPVTGFGASIAKGSLLEAERTGIIGLFRREPVLSACLQGHLSSQGKAWQ